MKDIGLALGGGAAKGFIHIGLLRYLEEKDYKIKEVAGTSMGAIIGAMIALGMSSKEIYEKFDDIDYKDIIDIDRKNASIQGNKILDMLKEVFGDKEFNQLDIPLTVIATDIDTGDEIVFKEGKVIDALRYSMSIPGVFSLYKGRKLVDGGISNNLPVNHLSQEHCIASSCKGFGDFEVDKKVKTFGIEHDEMPFKFTGRLIRRAVFIMMKRIEDLHIEKCPHEVVLIRPNIGVIQRFDFSVLDETVEKGYNEAAKVLGKGE